MKSSASGGKWRFDNNAPIFKQISDRLMYDIASRKYSPGEKFPSVRELALEIGVNPNTVQRALASLEESGILETHRGDGRYVSAATDDMARISLELTRDVCEKFISAMRGMGLSDGEILDSLTQTLEERKKSE